MSTRVFHRQCCSRSWASRTRRKYGAQLGVLREVLGPVVGGLERVAVEVAADVDARARVAVLPPRATGTAVLLDDRERQVRLGEAERGQQPRLAAADDDDVGVGAHVVGDLVGPRDRARVGTVEVKVFQEHGDDVVVERRAREERHHLADELVRGRRREHAPAVAELDDRGQCPRACRSLLVLRHAALVVVEDRVVRAQVAADPRRVTRDVDHRAEQRRGAQVVQRGGDGGVVVGEGRPA